MSLQWENEKLIKTLIERDNEILKINNDFNIQLKEKDDELERLKIMINDLQNEVNSLDYNLFSERSSGEYYPPYPEVNYLGKI